MFWQIVSLSEPIHIIPFRKQVLSFLGIDHSIHIRSNTFAEFPPELLLQLSPLFLGLFFHCVH